MTDAKIIAQNVSTKQGDGLVVFQQIGLKSSQEE